MSVPGSLLEIFAGVALLIALLSAGQLAAARAWTRPASSDAGHARDGGRRIIQRPAGPARADAGARLRGAGHRGHGTRPGPARHYGRLLPRPRKVCRATLGVTMAFVLIIMI
jgi:hypothetical protein